MIQDQFQIRIESLQKTVEDLSRDLREKEERLATMALNFQKAEKSEAGAKMQVNAIIEYFKDCHANNISWEDALRKVDDFRRYDVRFTSLTELLSFLDGYERVVHDLEEGNPGLKKDMWALVKEQRSFIRRNFSFFPRISNAFGLYLGAAPLWARMSTVLSSLGVLLGAICAFYLVRSSLDVNKLYFLIERSREAWLATPWTHTYARLLAEDAYLSNMIADLQYYIDAASQGDPQAKAYLARNNLTADLVKQSLGSLYQKYSTNQDKIAFWLEQNSETLATTAKEQDLRAVLAEQLKQFHADYAKNRIKK